MRKIFTIIVIAILAISLTACAGNPVSQPASSQPSLQSSASTQTAVQSQAASASAPAASSASSSLPSAGSTSSAAQNDSDNSVLDDINASLNDMGGVSNNLETVNPSDLQD